MATIVTDPKTGKPKRICGAKRKDGSLCQRYCIKGRDNCARHGGKNPIGPANPHFLHGKYSKILRRDVLQDYFQALASDDIYSQTDEIAVYDARMSQLLRQASTGREYEKLIRELRESSIAIRVMLASKAKDKEEFVLDEGLLEDLAHNLNEMVDELTAERKYWDEFYLVVENRRKLIESERKRQIDAQKMITEQQAQVLIAALLNIIRKHVLDNHARDAIAADLVQLSYTRPSRELTAEPS